MPSAAYSFNKVLNHPKLSPDATEDVKRLRRYILLDGIPSAEDPTIRPRVWKILLQVHHLSADTYLGYVARGPCEGVKEKIRNDTLRCVVNLKF